MGHSLSFFEGVHSKKQTNKEKTFYNRWKPGAWKTFQQLIQVHNFTPYLQWVELVSHSAKKEQGENNNAKLTGVLLANKTDLEDRRIISPKLGTDLAGQLGLMYFECSAKDNKDVENPIYFLASEWHKVYTESSERLSSN